MRGIQKYITLLLLCLATTLLAREPQIVSKKKGKPFVFKAANCDRPSSEIDLDINNVKTRILAGGDMWWDLSTAKYEVPNGSGKNSLFAGSLWIGGVDETNNLKIAAMTYRQSGVDFWTGPINKTTVSTDKSVCSDYDKHWKINRQEVEDYVTELKEGGSPDIPACMLDYPAHGNQALGHDYYLAPFHDADGDGAYNPAKGDYPDYNIEGEGCGAELFGDETIWWVFNDVGNIHSETGASAIGLEIHAQAFGFKTNDEINDMTFYNYKIFNRSSFELSKTYFGVWVDPDLGNFEDDYVGCDVERGLGYCYNGDANDEGEKGYGTDPPAVGVDFFQGPEADAGDGIDNDRDGTIDEAGEKIIMSKFVYYNNDVSTQGNPRTGVDFYGYLKGIWLDGNEMTYGGNGKGGGAGATGVKCDFMFPGTSDQTNHWGTKGVPQAAWDEVTAGNSPADRRFLQSAGPFSLKPGAVNTITTGVVWARGATGTGPAGAVEKLKAVDDKAQSLFDNCFKVLNGPDAPSLTIQEMKNELIVVLENSSNSNNASETYEEKDPLIPIDVNNYDTTYNFQGYQVFQLKNSSVSSSELSDPAKARLVFQCDIEDGISKIVNHVFDNDIGYSVPTVMVNGENKGLKHSFSVKKDLFAEGDDKLVNEKEYYFMAVAYGYNNFLAYDGSTSSNGQKSPYLAGRRNIKVYTAVPHDAGIEGNGTIINSVYGASPEITRTQGVGTSDIFTNLSDETKTTILSSPYSTSTPKYAKGGPPVGVKVIDPLKIPDGDFKLEILDTITAGDLRDAYWRLIFVNEKDTVYSDKTIKVANEQIISKWGLSVEITQADTGGYAGAENFGLIGDSIIFKDPTKPWLSAVKDVDGTSPYNWIRAGSAKGENNLNEDKCNGGANADCNDFVDPTGVFEKVIDGWVAPFFMVSDEDFGPNTTGPQYTAVGTQLTNLNSFDLVLTNDKTKWSKCPVVEMAGDGLGDGAVNKLDLRTGTGTGINGETLEKGMSYFPGYALDVTTGQRLNIMFGENSFKKGENGGDMIWNPTNNEYSDFSEPLFGGFHTIFVFTSKNASVNTLYDEGKSIYDKLNSGNWWDKNAVFNSVSWVMAYPKINPAYGLLATDATIKIRINQRYEASGSDLPVFEFNTKDIRAVANQNATAVQNLDKVNVVPNPYYGFSQYETSKFENKVKITNLPQKCKIKIFTLNGTLVRTIVKDDSQSENEATNVTWDLKNDAGVPIGSGAYIIHVEAEGIGTKILKWFGVMRQDDLETF